MRDYQLRTDLKRSVMGDFALPLGFAPPPVRMRPPVQGYTVAYVPGEEDDPETYSFQVVVSHERLAPILHRAFDLLPDEVFAIVEIGSRDAYRSTDVYMTVDGEALSLDEFRQVWSGYETFLLEDASIAAGVNSEDPFIEVFMDQWKGLFIHVPLSMRDEVEHMLAEFELEEVPETWSAPAAGDDEPAEEPLEAPEVRSVLDLSDEYAPDVDELLLDLRHDWKMELNVDPESNIDEGGRDLGDTLWHALVIVDRPAGGGPANGNRAGRQGAYASVWATAGSLDEMEQLIGAGLADYPEWTFNEIYTIDRVAFDERPETLADLRPNRRAAQVHLVSFEPWNES